MNSMPARNATFARLHHPVLSLPTSTSAFKIERSCFRTASMKLAWCRPSPLPRNSLTTLPSGIVGDAAPTLAFESSSLAVSDVATAGARMLGTLLCIGRRRKIRQPDHDRNRTGVEVGEMHIGCLSGIIPDDTSATTKDPFGQCHRITKDVVAQVVQDMNTPVAHFARAGIPIPMPIVVQFVTKDRLILGRAKPQVVGDVFFDRQEACPSFQSNHECRSGSRAPQ